MIFPALVFLGLKNNDCCGCCGNESCGKRFAVSEGKHGKNARAELLPVRSVYLLLAVIETRRCLERGTQSAAVCPSAGRCKGRL